MIKLPSLDGILKQSEAGNIAPIAVVMLPEGLALAAKPQHLNG